MKNLNFKDWFEHKIISFDFDSTLTKPVYNQNNKTWDAGDPTDSTHHHLNNIETMLNFAKKGYTIYIVTSRYQKDIPEVEQFVKELKLPVEKIIATNGKHKGPILKSIGVETHYDDLEQVYEDPDKVFTGQWIKIYHPQDGF